MPDAGQKQHVEAHRKIALRQRMLAQASPGAIYVPYCGDADIAAELYSDRQIVGCDSDPARVATARTRGLNARFEVADAETFADFEDLEYAAADFDAYAYPFNTFRAFMAHAKKAPRLVLFFTDGELQVIRRLSHGWTRPDGEHIAQLPLDQNRAIVNDYWGGTVFPYLVAAMQADGYRIAAEDHYTRSGTIVYSGIVADRIDAPAAQPNDRVDRPKRVAVRTYDPMKASKLNHAARGRFLRHVSEGLTKTAAARAIGVSLRTIEMAEHGDPAFRDQIEQARWEADDEVEDALYRAARSGNVPAALAWLQNRRPTEWYDRRAKVTKYEVDNDSLRLILSVITGAVTDADTLDRIRTGFARLANSGLAALGNGGVDPPGAGDGRGRVIDSQPAPGPA